MFMTAIEAALFVLNEAKTPLHVNEITRHILAKKLWQTKGKTPEATINARIAMDIKTKGTASAFQRVKPGVYRSNHSGYLDAMHEQSAPTLRSEVPPIYGINRPLEKPMSFTDAAELILRNVAGPKHYREITELAIANSLLNTTGKTPEATMYSQILTEYKRRERRGQPQRFRLLGRGMVGLMRFPQKEFAVQIERANKEIRKQMLTWLKDLAPHVFEQVIYRLLAAIGFEDLELTTPGNDGGIDVRGTLNVGDTIRTRIAVQAKRWENNVQRPVVQQVRGSLGTHEQGLIITTSDFSKGAKEEAQRSNASPIGLMNGEELVNLLIENEIGVRKTSMTLLELSNDKDGMT